MNRTLAQPIKTCRGGWQPAALYWLCLLLLCSACIQGGLVRAFDFPGAVAETRRFGLAPEGLLAFAAIVGELGACIMVLTGVVRWAGAAYLACFAFAANLVANRFWELEGLACTMSANGFFQHLGLVGAFLLVAWVDVRERRERG